MTLRMGAAPLSASASVTVTCAAGTAGDATVSDAQQLVTQVGALN